MAGQPKYRKLCKDIEEAGGVEHVIRRFLEGEEPWIGIARSFGLESTFCLDKWRKQHLTEDEWEAVKRDRAAGYVAEAENLLRNARPNTAAEARVTSDLASHLTWRAKCEDRETWADTPPSQANQAVVDLATAFREMLETVNKPRAILEADYEIEDEAPRLEGADGTEE